ncbi:flagellar assembly protein FliW [Dethiothermospora halolimnae]|uniref:flagellar assembly protein FliW n=1 Tax=Dethiothermospora halolimnae TaxID=3114390 RepID=UPI003CCC0708
MQLKTKHFGEITIEKEKIITFKNGLYGFEDQNRFTIIENNDKENPFQWLQSIDDSNLAFVVINPFIFKPDYDFDIPDSTVDKLEIEDPKDLLIYTIAVVPEDIKDVTVNLSGPIIINSKNKLGKQIIIEDKRYTTKYYIFKELEQMDGEE